MSLGLAPHSIKHETFVEFTRKASRGVRNFNKYCSLNSRDDNLQHKKNEELKNDNDTEDLSSNNVAEKDLEEILLNDEYDEYAECSEEELLNNEIEENFGWFDNEIEENAELLIDNLSKDIEKFPLSLLTTKYRKKIEAKKDAEKN
nr:8043_t:CDS:2 [Entrophospora candida]